MKLTSFRLRIALLSAVLAGSALIGFSALSWWLIYDAKLKRLDANLENQLLQAMRPRSPDWNSFIASLPLIIGGGRDSSVGLIVLEADGNLIYRSNYWRDELDANALWQSIPPPPPQSESERRPLSENFSDRLPPLPRPDYPPPRARNNLPPPPEDRPPDALPAPPMKLATRHLGASVWRIGVIRNPRLQAAIAVNLQAIDAEMAGIRQIFLIVVPIALVILGGGAWLISGSVLYPIRRLIAAIRSVSAQGLDRRVPAEATDEEFVELIHVFNQMLERLERSFKQSLRFSGDAAHELKTPLAILQGELERALVKAEPESVIQQNLCNLLDEVRQLSEIVRKLLLLSLADAGRMNLHRVKVNLSVLLEEIAEDMELLAPDLAFHMESAADLCIMGDRDLLIRVLQNLFANAIKYNLPQGWVKLKANYQGKFAVVNIANSSKDIPLKERDRIFDRFHRGDPSQTQKIEGSGLGLSLAWEIVRAHGGDLKLDPPVLGQTSFTLRLPVST